MITIIATWKVNLKNLELVKKYLNELQRESRKEPGCKRYDWYSLSENHQCILIHEEYDDAEAIQFHRGSSHFQKIAIEKIIPLLEERSVKVLSDYKV